jgi:hypothetical protein
MKNKIHIMFIVAAICIMYDIAILLSGIDVDTYPTRMKWDAIAIVVHTVLLVCGVKIGWYIWKNGKTRRIQK